MNELLALSVPIFARLTDYLGPWCMEPEAFARLWNFAERINLPQHVEDGAEPARSSMELTAGPGNKKIAVIKVAGVLMKSQSSLGGTSTIQLRREVRQAVADEQVAGIMLAIDSPGGTVAGTDDLAKDVKAARKQKPVWAFVQDTAASAAYWIASQADRVIANSPTALTGSIGTYQVIHDVSGAHEKMGVRSLLFSTGPLKGVGAMGAKITDEQAGHVQSLVNTAQESFDAAVQSGRHLTDKQLADVRHGGVMLAKEAQQRKLIDAIQTDSKTMAEFAAALKGGTAGHQAALALLATGRCEIDQAGELYDSQPPPKPQSSGMELLPTAQLSLLV